MRLPAAFPALILPPLLVACGGGGSSSAPADLAVLALSEPPTVEIGVLEGDPAYQFQEVVAALRLPSGHVAVADAGGARVLVYGRDGTASAQFGGQGEGPAEFGNLGRLFWRDDLLLAFDTRNERLSVFDADGTFRGTRDHVAISQDSVFELDVWLYGRFWVDGAFDAQVRERLRSVLDGLPPPVAPPGFRLVRVGADGRLWVREPGITDDGMRGWTVLEPDGTPTASIRTPTAFDPLDIRTDELVGRWIGEADVHFVRAYDVVETGETTPVPDWLRAGDASAAAQPVDEEEVRPLIVSAIRTMASAQEIHYSEHYTYTTDVAALERWEQPEGIDVTFVTGDRRGWSAAFAHPGYDSVCALGYGASMPPGWTPGAVVCAPPTDPPDGEAG